MSLCFPFNSWGNQAFRE